MFKNMKIGTKLAVGCGTSMALMMVLIVYGVVQIRHLNTRISVVVEDRMAKTRQANTLIESLSEY